MQKPQTIVRTALPTQLLLFVCDAGDPLHNAGCAGPLCGQWEGGVQGTAALSRTDKGKVLRVDGQCEGKFGVRGSARAVRQLLCVQFTETNVGVSARVTA